MTFSDPLTTSVLSVSQVTESDNQARFFCRAVIDGVTIDSSTATMTVYRECHIDLAQSNIALDSKTQAITFYERKIKSSTPLHCDGFICLQSPIYTRVI